MQKNKGEKDIIVSDLREKLLNESIFLNIFFMFLDRSLKGALVSAKGLMEEDKSQKNSIKDPIDSQLDGLRKSQNIKCIFCIF